MQAKRIQVIEGTTAVGSVSVSLDVPDEPREQVNFHNIWGGFTVEPESTAVNSQGTWVLYTVPSGGSLVSWFDATVNTETNNIFIIACGVWGASNESPYTAPPIQIGTSRNLNAGDKLVLGVTQTGITAGNSSIKVILCAHTVRK